LGKIHYYSRKHIAEDGYIEYEQWFYEEDESGKRIRDEPVYFKKKNEKTGQVERVKNPNIP
jgi:hypothetical protein